VLLWQQLRRQHPFGRYVVDFYAACAKLVVEIDGGVHEKQHEYDAPRQAEIERVYCVRFVRVSAERGGRGRAARTLSGGRGGQGKKH
jgi:very-short-patch-repair endonuclease